MVFFNNEKSKFAWQESPPYRSLAAIYDQVMRHVEYDRWANYIKNLMNRHLQSKVEILDIGCGTGQFIAELAKLGIRSDGCDPSRPMLEIARHKNPDKKFWIDRFPVLEKVPQNFYQVMTALYDTINYLAPLSNLISSFNRVFELLPPGGLFVFDAVSEQFCQTYFNGFREQEKLREKIAYDRYSYYDYPSNSQINEFTIYTPEGVFEEKHVQRIYPFEEIRSVIRNQTCFELAAIYEDFTFFTADKYTNRAHFVLRKN